jgi:hypothetical protein
VTVLTILLGFTAVAGLCYPRRPRATGVLFLVAGGFMLVMWATGAIGDAPPILAGTCAALGLGMHWRFREPAVRAAHVAEWAGRS